MGLGGLRGGGEWAFRMRVGRGLVAGGAFGETYSRIARLADERSPHWRFVGIEATVRRTDIGRHVAPHLLQHTLTTHMVEQALWSPQEHLARSESQ